MRKKFDDVKKKTLYIEESIARLKVISFTHFRNKKKNINLKKTSLMEEKTREKKKFKICKPISNRKNSLFN